jgi:23S rRNA pseudouridine955/2504/2580 synthase
MRIVIIASVETPRDNTLSDVRRVRITDELSGQRIDNFLLRELRGVPRSLVYRLLRRGEVRVNGGRIRQTYRLEAGDEVRLPPVRTGRGSEAQASDRVRSRLEAAILYEDDQLLVLDKPSGMAVHGGSGIGYGVVEALRQQRPENRFLDLCHRLDRDTSGCLLLAKRRSALRAVHELIRENRLDKRYLTLLRGRVTASPLPVEARLGRRQGKGGETFVRVVADGKPSRTVFRVRERFDGWTLAEAELITGRTHQIRVHGELIRHPVAGDERYGDADANRQLRELGLRRLFLHASRLVLPATDDTRALTVEAPLPHDLARLLERLRAAGASISREEVSDDGAS